MPVSRVCETVEGAWRAHTSRGVDSRCGPWLSGHLRKLTSPSRPSAGRGIRFHSAHAARSEARGQPLTGSSLALDHPPAMDGDVERRGQYTSGPGFHHCRSGIRGAFFRGCSASWVPTTRAATERHFRDSPEAPVSLHSSIEPRTPIPDPRLTPSTSGDQIFV